MNLRRHHVANQSLCILLSFILLMSGCISFGPCKKGTCQDGHGVYSDGKGAVYTGEFKDGKYHGNGEMRWTAGIYGDHYLAISGTATGIWKNGEVYTGTIDKSTSQGQIDKFTPQLQSRTIQHIENGKLTYGSDTRQDRRYEYTVSNGTLIQKIVYNNGQIYVGPNKVGNGAYLPHGSGTMTFPDGKKYVGEWKDGQPTTGVYYSANGTPIKTPKGISTSAILLGLGLLFIGGLAVSSLGGGHDSSPSWGSEPEMWTNKWVRDPEDNRSIRGLDYYNKYGQIP